ncbi:MAG: DUF2235 domain-containing protein [Rhodobacteraceae bacterium]|nr:DUF2235 domain-containing protein [Paracoccaceae bacterium]
MARKPIIHAVVIDGTLSTLDDIRQSNAGRLRSLLIEIAEREKIALQYLPGIQWCTYGNLLDVVAGRGLTRQVRQVYGGIAARYRPGDRIFLFGFSRGAYAVRSLAGVIDLVGLLKQQHATERNIRQVFRYYRADPYSRAARSFSSAYCCKNPRIEMVGVWDTVKALGIPFPLLWRLAPDPTDFHNHELGKATRNGFQALALDETRTAFRPVLWDSRKGWNGRLEQAWFRGAHGDIGGQIDAFQAARPLANIPLVWMLENAERCGLPLPQDWRGRFACDPDAPAYGDKRGIGRFFLYRSARLPLRDASEYIHPSAAPRETAAAPAQP